MAISFSSVTPRDAVARGHGVTAVLGPTNTGKTHLAIERMLAHSSGIIGLPLRLLAREVYNKAVERVGADAVALITGEEKIKPPSPRYLGGDGRGHAARPRYRLRGDRRDPARRRPRARPCVHGPHPQPARPRGNAGAGRRHHAPDGGKAAARSQYSEPPAALAAHLRGREEAHAPAAPHRHRGVLGRGGLRHRRIDPPPARRRRRRARLALAAHPQCPGRALSSRAMSTIWSPPMRSAWGSISTSITSPSRPTASSTATSSAASIPAELAQIAGRAGRAMRDGTFGTTGRCPPFEPELVQALESHSFESVKIMQWRNTDLDFASLGALAASLATVPTLQGLTRAPTAEDILVLDHVARDEDVRALATTRVAVERLWEVCQVPDYRKISPAAHSELVVALYGFLMRQGRIPDDWFAAASRAGRSHRRRHRHAFATYRAHQDLDLCGEPSGLAHRSRPLARRHPRRRGQALRCAARAAHRAFRRSPHQRVDAAAAREHACWKPKSPRPAKWSSRAMRSAGSTDSASPRRRRRADRKPRRCGAAAQKALAGEIEARATRLSQAPDSQFVLAAGGTIRWIGEAVAKLTAGDNVLRPRVRILADEHLTGAAQEHVQTRLDLWTRTHIERLLGAAVRARRRRGRHRARARHRLPGGRGARRARALEGRRGRQEPRSAGARHSAQARRAVRRVSHLRAGAAQAGAARARRRAVGAQAWRARDQGARRGAAARVERRTSFPVDKDDAEGALPHHRLSRVRRARGARRHPGAARRPDPPGARLARSGSPAASRPARSTAAASRSRRR